MPTPTPTSLLYVSLWLANINFFKVKKNTWLGISRAFIHIYCLSLPHISFKDQLSKTCRTGLTQSRREDTGDQKNPCPSETSEMKEMEILYLHSNISLVKRRNGMAWASKQTTRPSTVPISTQSGAKWEGAVRPWASAIMNRKKPPTRRISLRYTMWSLWKGLEPILILETINQYVLKQQNIFFILEKCVWVLEKIVARKKIPNTKK